MKVIDFLETFDWDNYGKNLNEPSKHVRISWWDRGLNIEIGIKEFRNLDKDLKYFLNKKVLDAEIDSIDTIFNVITLNISEEEK